MFWVYGYFVFFIFGTVLGFWVNLFWVYVISFLLSVGILLGLWAFDFDGHFKIYWDCLNAEYGWMLVGAYIYRGRIYFCGGDFTLLGMFFPFAMDILLCCGCIYLCMGVFISVGAISHCQECFCHLLWMFCFAMGVFTSVWA